MDLNTKGFIKKKVSFALKMIVLVICFIIYMFPFVMVVINSFKTKRDIIKEPLSLIGTNGASVANYVEAFTKMNFPRTFMNSLCVTGISVLLIIVVSSMCAYIFVRTDYKLNKIFFSLMIASMVIPFQVIMIPPVSYTHLDVYKRQKLYCAGTLWCGAGDVSLELSFHALP